jgi:hypothetical protein
MEKEHCMVWKANGSIVLLFALIVFCAALFSAPASAEDSICARVKIEIDQKLTLERQAFDAHMKINNGLSNISLENVGVAVTFADADGNAVRATSNPSDTSALF